MVSIFNEDCPVVSSEWASMQTTVRRFLEEKFSGGSLNKRAKGSKEEHVIIWRKRWKKWKEMEKQNEQERDNETEK